MVNSSFKKILSALPLLSLVAAPVLFSGSANALKLKISTDFDQSVVRSDLVNSTAQGERTNSVDMVGVCNPNVDYSCSSLRLNDRNDNELYLDSSNNVMAWAPNNRHADYEHFLVSSPKRADKEFEDRYTIITADQMKTDSKYGAVASEKALIMRNNLVNFYKGNPKLFTSLTSSAIPLSEFVKTCDNSKKCDASYNSKFGGFSRISHVGRATDAMTFYVVVVRHLDSKANVAADRDAGYTYSNNQGIEKESASHLRFQVIPVKFKPVYEKEGVG